MVTYNINNAVSSDYTNAVDDVTVGALSTDGITAQKETEWQNTNWTSQWGYFNAIPDLQAALLMKSIWNVGNGYTTNARTEVILDRMTGWSKDTFQDILFNMDVIRYVGGDSYSHIIRNDKGTLINLKPLDPGSMKHVVGPDGVLIRYEQVSKIKDKPVKKFQPNEIFHLCNDRLADQIHGISKITALEETIKADNENFVDMKKLMHHQVKPFILWKLKTDDATKIAEVVAKIDAARNLGEDMFIPDDDDAISYEIVQINVSNAIFEWRNDIRNKFYRNVGLPQVVPGSGGMSTESESKTIYFAFETIVKYEQRYLEAQIWAQLGIRIKLTPPQSMSQDLQQDSAKDAGGLAPQPSDTQAGVGR